MKKHTLKIYISLLVVFVIFIVANVFIGKAADPTAADICNDQSNIYNDTTKTTEEIMTMYHQKMNDKFNGYIRKMILAEAAAAKNPSQDPDPNGLPPAPVSADNPNGLLPCPTDGSNYSTYCVAVNLANDDKEGYIAYRRALNCRRGKLFETSQQEDDWNKWINTTTCLGITTGDCAPDKIAALKEKIGNTYQGQKAMDISARLSAIDRETDSAKRALDQTLAAYNELRTAWPMHKIYMHIYDSLIKYRDKMVEIRNQVEEFPSKFIDASTTKCS